MFTASPWSEHVPNVPNSKPTTGTTNAQRLLQEDRGENTRVSLEATLAYQCWRSSDLRWGRKSGYITESAVLYSSAETSRAWKLRWCLWLLSRLNNSRSSLSFLFSFLFFLEAGFSCGGRWSPAVSVQPALKDTVKMQHRISYSACVYTWNRASSGHQHLISSCCQPVSLAEGKQHRQLEWGWDDIWDASQRWWTNLLVKRWRWFGNVHSPASI